MYTTENFFIIVGIVFIVAIVAGIIDAKSSIKKTHPDHKKGE